jgi:hypothetical protein
MRRPNERRIVNRRTEKHQLGGDWHVLFQQVFHAGRRLLAKKSARDTEASGRHFPTIRRGRADGEKIFFPSVTEWFDSSAGIVRIKTSHFTKSSPGTRDFSAG